MGTEHRGGGRRRRTREADSEDTSVREARGGGNGRQGTREAGDKGGRSWLGAGSEDGVTSIPPPPTVGRTSLNILTSAPSSKQPPRVHANHPHLKP